MPEDGIPEGVDAGGPALLRFFKGIDHGEVIFLQLIGGVDEHQAAARGGGQQGHQPLEAVAMVDGDAGVVPHVGAKILHLVVVQLHQRQLVLIADKAAGQLRRAGVVVQLTIAVHLLDDTQIGGHGRPLGPFIPQAFDPVGVFRLLLGPVAAQVVETATGMGVQHDEGFLLLLEGLDDQGLDGVFEHVGVVAGVKGVAVAQHMRSLRGPCWAPSNDR